MCLKDILIDELIHREGWLQRSVNVNRPKIENSIRIEWINKYHETAEKVIINPGEENLSTLKSLIDGGKPESEEAELELLKIYWTNYENIYEHFEKVTNNFSEEELVPHHPNSTSSA